jgi:biotin operon repressor
MTFDRDTGFSRMFRETVETVAQMVESLLVRHPEGLSTTTIAEALGKSKDSIRKVISQSGMRIIGKPIDGSRNRKLYTLAESATVDDDLLAGWEDKVAG